VITETIHIRKTDHTIAKELRNRTIAWCGGGVIIGAAFYVFIHKYASAEPHNLLLFSLVDISVILIWILLILYTWHQAIKERQLSLSTSTITASSIASRIVSQHTIHYENTLRAGEFNQYDLSLSAGTLHVGLGVLGNSKFGGMGDSGSVEVQVKDLRSDQLIKQETDHWGIYLEIPITHQSEYRIKISGKQVVLLHYNLHCRFYPQTTSLRPAL